MHTSGEAEKATEVFNKIDGHDRCCYCYFTWILESRVNIIELHTDLGLEDTDVCYWQE